MVNGHHNSPKTADGDILEWKSEVVGFIEDAQQELRNILNSLQQGSPLEPASRPQREPATTLNVERATTNSETTPIPVETAEQNPADHDDRLEQLKRRVEEQLRTAKRN